MTASPASIFWNDVFQHSDRSLVKDRSADESIGMMAMVGPFEEELAAAKSVLDVGPGEARLLRSVPEKDRYAIEVSDLNRERLKAHGIAAAEPGADHGLPDAGVDLAWSTSCLQHVDPAGQRQLLDQIARSLRPGGLLYLEHVESLAVVTHAASKIGPAGGWWVGAQVLLGWASEVGLFATDPPLYRRITAAGPLRGYFLRLVKGRPSAPMDLSEYTSITAEEAGTYCAGSENQRVRDVIAARVGERTVVDLGCGPGIDAGRYAPTQYIGIDVSSALVEEAKRRHPQHVFLGGRIGGKFAPPQCVLIKSVLEHCASVAVAVDLLKLALSMAKEEVYVAWHTPPREREVLCSVPGHFGKTVWQNTWALRDFEWAQPRRVEQVDNFELWTLVAVR